MKIRQGFVSNSSSSSFICDLTGEDFDTGYMSYADCGVVGCVNGHGFAFDGYPDVEAYLASDQGENADDKFYALPAELCPICNGSAKKVLVEKMTKELKRLNLTVDDFT